MELFSIKIRCTFQLVSTVVGLLLQCGLAFGCRQTVVIHTQDTAVAI